MKLPLKGGLPSMIVACALLGGALARAQLKWSEYSDIAQTLSGTSYAAGQLVASNVASGGDVTTGGSASSVSFTVPAGATVDFATSNFAPITLSGSNTAAKVTFTFSASGGLTGSTARTFALGFLNSTGTTLLHDGYSVIANLGSSPQAFELYSEPLSGNSPVAGAMLTFSSTTKLSSGKTTGLTFANSTTYPGSFQINYVSGNVQIGTSSSSATAGVSFSQGSTLLTGYGTSISGVFPNPTFTVNTFVLGYYNSTGSPVTLTLGAVSLVPIGPPTITTQPSNAATSLGAGATFTVASVSNPAATYQWFYVPAGGSAVSLSNGTQGDGSTIAGATTSTLTIGNAQADEDQGSFYVVLSNAQGTATSGSAVLSVAAAASAPQITTQPVASSVNAGASATFAAAASGGPAPTFQWYFIPSGGTASALADGNGISGSATGTLTLTTVNPTQAGSYYAVATNSAGTATTNTVPLTVINAGPSISALSPSGGASGACIDTPLSITFSKNVVLGTTGKVRIYNASTNALVDTIDLTASGQTAAQILAANGIEAVQGAKTLEGQSFNYYPIYVNGATATIVPHASLSYATGYYVTIDTGVFLDATSGNSFVGIYDAVTWGFATKAAGPAAGATSLNVRADGTGDFCTVQGALDFLPAANTQPVTISIASGTYYALIFDNGRSNVSFVGASRTGTVLEYANNNTFDSVGGSFYHRGAFEAYASNLAFLNLTVRNTTPHGGSQAEALIVQGSQNVLSNVSLYSYQDTLQINGSAYVGDSYIEGDVDFMWGTGPNFFYNCELKAATSNGYYAQIRNNQPSGTANHGNVYVNCTLDAEAGVTGSYLARIDPTVFPYSEVVYIGCRMGTNINAVGWLLNNATTAPTINYAYANLTDLSGNPLSTAGWQYATQITDPAILQNYQTASYVLNGWNPTLAPQILTQPTSVTTPGGQTASFTVAAAAVPEPSYRWYLNGAPLSDGTQADGSVISGSGSATITVQNAGSAEAGSYSALVSNGVTSASSQAASLTLTQPLPAFTTQPSGQTASSGASVSFTAAASNASSYQWYYDGAALSANPSSTTSTLTLAGITAANAGSYCVVATDSSGSTTSAEAILNVVAAAGQPTLPTIPSGTFLVTAYGAVGDGVTDNTAAIQSAVNAALAAGGGTVEFPAASGAYLSGPFTLGSGLHLQVDAGALLRALPYTSYPNTGNNPANFIGISKASNVLLSGAGTIDGNGSAWWAAYNASSSVKRPQLIKFSGATNVLVTGLTLSNGPTEHLVLDSSTNVTIDAVAITAPSTSPNTDGIDPAGTNYLIENCSIAVGDDNIAIKPQNVLCSNFTITGCAFGVGHGLSVGGQTNSGLNGMTVTNCTFNGTTSGLRLKADATEGGLVQNLTYSNITMTGVEYPIVFYSYYNEIGTVGAQSGSSAVTPAKVQSWNVTPPNSLATSTIPGWQNITISNLTATGASNYSTIWGLPLANGLIQGVVLNNVTISGAAGLEIYDAANVQFTGSTSVGAIVTDNALAITGQPQSQAVNAGTTATFTVTAAGTSGTTGTGPTYAWSLNGTALSDGPQADGSVVSGSSTATLTIANAQVGDSGPVVATVTNALDGYNTASNGLVNNSLSVSASSSGAALTVSQVAATVTLGNLNQAYSGNPAAVTASTLPAGLPVQISYNGSATAPTDAGSYAVTATITNPSYSGSASGTLVIEQASASLSAPSGSAVYTGAVQTPGLTSSPSGLALLYTYNGVAAAISPDADGTLLSYRGAVGQTLYVQVTGETTGSAYGTGPFAINSDLGAAAVYAGLLSPGQTAVLQVTLLPAGQAFGAGNQNAVATSAEAPGQVAVQLTGLASSGYTLGPVTAGSYAVVATSADPNYAGSAQGTFTITQASPTLAWTAPAAIPYGTPLGGAQLSATASVPGSFAYAPGAGTVLNAGASQALTATFTPADANDYTSGSVSTTLTVNPAPAQVDLSGLTQQYDGSGESVGWVTLPGNEPVSVTYDGSGADPVNAGSYSVVASVTDPNYVGSATGTLVIQQAPASVSLSALTPTYDGTAKAVAVTTSPSGLATTVSYNGSATAPTAAGSYPVTVTITDPNYVGSATGTLVIGQAVAQVSLGGLAQTYDGTGKAASVTVNPAGLATTLTYAGSSVLPVNAGSYAVTATVTDPNYVGSATGTLVIGQAGASVSLGDLEQVYTGSPLSAVAATTPSGLATSLTYNGASAAPTLAGSYAVTATITDPNYSGLQGGTLVISKAVAQILIGNTTQTYSGSPEGVSVTTLPSGLATVVTYNGSTTAPTAVGTYSVGVAIADSNYSGAAAATLAIQEASATISLGNLAQMYDGTAKAVSVATTPSGLATSVTYDGGAAVPVLPGTYAVSATITDPNHSGTATGTLVIGITALVNNAPTLNAGLDGSIQVLSAQSFALNGNAYVSGDALVVGTPTVQQNGKPTYAGTIDGTGSTSPSNYTVTLNGGSVLRHVVRRTPAIALPEVPTPPSPTGTTNVSVNSSTQAKPNFTTLKNLTLNSNVGSLAVPAGTYGTFTANSGSGFTLGVAGATTPSVYNLQGLTLNSSSSLTVVGPVILNVAGSVTFNSGGGSSANPGWLVINVANGSVTLNSSVTVNAHVIDPTGTVTINSSTLNGTVAADSLTLNGSALLNQAP